MTEQVRVRPMIAAKERGPGPGRYVLPSALGSTGHDATRKKAPGYSFGTKLPSSLGKATDSPGPKHKPGDRMTAKGNSSSPAYSMSTRPSGFKLERTPAPGAYSPEKVTVARGKAAPAYSMRQRTQGKKLDHTPAANTYNLKSTVGASAKYSISGRSNKGGFSQDLAGAPGPGKYNPTAADVYKKKAPGYSMGARTYMPSDQTKKPGPGAHNPAVPRKGNPSYSMGQRHSEYTTQLIVDVPDI
eukprot:m.126019 g.126019  ORF g.126019 m.126019 type:complete len:243 (-) comp17349_c0_seq6:184-912(-)